MKRLLCPDPRLLEKQGIAPRVIDFWSQHVHGRTQGQGHQVNNMIAECRWSKFATDEYSMLYAHNYWAF